MGTAHLGAAEMRELLERHGIAPSRSLGQNFVHDPNTIDRIVRASGIGSDDSVIEIGPGLGSLTVGLAPKAARVVAIELDRHLLSALSEVLERRGLEAKVEVVNADANDLHWAEFHRSHPGRWKMVANLPYNVAVPLLMNVLDEAPFVEDLLVMVQREVGERLAAVPGTADYGIPSVKAQYWADVNVVGRVPASVFHPVPRVESVLVRLRRRPEVPRVDLDLLWALVREAFGQRRKMLRRSLAATVAPEVFANARIDPSLRPQDLDVDSWVALARSVSDHEVGPDRPESG